MKVSNIWKARLSTFIGVAITVLTAVGTQLATGEINWKAVVSIAIPAAILSLTDILKELQKDLGEEVK